ncbi:MAG: class I SAM-dependent DNA methyltransferase [Chitinophagales bacterium]
MNKKFEKIIHQYIEDEHLVNQMIVTTFVAKNEIEVKHNRLIQSLLLDETNSHYLAIADLFPSFSFEELIEAFEVAIPSKDVQTNGAVYTPKNIKDFIISETLQNLQQPLESILGADISCGCGAFLYSLAIRIHEQINQTIEGIIEGQLYGLDINPSSILRAKILLSLLALSEGEDKEEFDFQLHVGNALDFNWREIEAVNENQGFNLIVGNPPYVRAKHIDEDSKKLLKKWQVTKSGNPDLYLPFFEIGYKNLNARGILGYITANSFYRSVNARSLRTYLEGYQVHLKIIDFGHEQIFGKKLAYTCLCFLSRTKSEQIYFAKSASKSLPSLKEQDFTPISYRNLDSHRGWLLNNPKAIENIQRIEACGIPLGKLYSIKNGIATLSNDTYIFKPLEEDDYFYFFEKKGKSYKVEKGVCRDIIKPNILKYEHEIPTLTEKLIYPYSNGINPLSLIEEDFFQSNYPLAYQYLLGFKDKLAKRDKGKGDYGAWYAFGRTQALKDKGLKLLFPYMAKQPYFVFTNQKEMLLYCGYAIFAESESDLLVLKKLLESKIFDYYMQNTSKPYASGYYSYAKNYVKNFGVCELSSEERSYLLGEEKEEEVNVFFEEKYGVKV